MWVGLRGVGLTLLLFPTLLTKIDRLSGGQTVDDDDVDDDDDDEDDSEWIFSMMMIMMMMLMMMLSLMMMLMMMSLLKRIKENLEKYNKTTNIRSI